MQSTNIYFAQNKAHNLMGDTKSINIKDQRAAIAAKKIGPVNAIGSFKAGVSSAGGRAGPRATATWCRREGSVGMTGRKAVQLGAFIGSERRHAR